MLLSGLPDRLRHSAGVAERAASVSRTVGPEDREVLVAAAWLHDIGYAPAIATTGFHPLDGARYLGIHGWPARVCDLVAHHSGALFVARDLGLDQQLDAYPDEHSPVTDALIYADQTVDTRGNRVSIGERHRDMLQRHGSDSAQARVHPARRRYLLAAAARVEHRLRMLRPEAP